MSVFDVDLKGQQQLDAEAEANPLYPDAIEPSAWQGALSVTGKGILRSGVKVADFMMTAGSMLDVSSSQSPRRAAQEKRKAEAVELQHKLRKDSLDYWTTKPGEAGSAAQVLGAFSEMILPLMVGGGNPALLLGSATLDTGKTMVDQGVDANTAVASALITDVTLAAGFRIPFVGKTVAGRAASGVAGNVALGLPSREAQQAILEANGYGELAKQYDYNGEAFMLDVLTGALFGGLSIVGMKNEATPAEKDALLTAKNAKHFQQDTAPGTPADVSASVAHQAALGDAIEQLLRGEPVNVADAITEAAFIRPVAPKETPIARALADAYPDVIKTDLSALPLAARRALPFNAAELDAFAAQIETRYNLPPGLINAIKNAGERSNSNQTSPAGARGVMQFMPENLKKYGVTDPTDPVQIIDAAGQYLRDTMKQYKGDVQAVIADYNGGPRQALRVSAGKQPAAAETRAYVERVSKELEKTTGKGLDRDVGLPFEQQDVETSAYGRVLRDTDAMVDDYFKRFGNVIDPDNVKELFPEYVENPALARAVHEPSSYLSKKIYAEALKRNAGQPVVFTAGGGGSGKTEAMPYAMAAAGLDKPGLTFDSTLSSVKSAITKIDQALQTGAPVHIVYTNRGVEDAFKFAMHRKRVVPIETLAKAHAGASDTIRQLQQHYRDNPNVAIVTVNNLAGKDAIKVGHIDDVFTYRYNDVERKLHAIADKALKNGEITPARHKALTGGGRKKGGGRNREVQAGHSGEDLGRPGTGAGSAPREAFGVGHYGADNLATTERGMIIPARYAVTDIGSLVTSHLNDLKTNPDFPQALQPRDRARAASEGQIARIENAINPELLGASPKAGDGAPIVGADNVVESGNARTIALRRAYDSRLIEDDGVTAPEPGQKFVVYRFGRGGDLANRNAGNAQSVARYIMGVQDAMAPTTSKAATVTAYEVTISAPFGKYEGLTKGAPGKGAEVGRVVRGKEVAYSFQGDKYSAKKLGDVSIDDLHATLKSRGSDNFDDAGTNLGAEVIRGAFSKVTGGKADVYKQWLITNAERFGLDPAAVAKMDKPALVRVGQGDYNRAEFARQANESSVAQMSVTELARADAERTPDLMGLVTNEDGSINPIQSAPFIQGFMAHVVSPSEHGTMMTADGMLSQQGLQRIRNAVFAKAYGDPEIVAMMAESTDANIKNVLGGMLRAAPAVARIQDLIAAGARYPIDITGDLVLAVQKFSQLRRDGMKVKDMLDQGALFDSGIRAEVQNLLTGLEENSRAPKRVAELIGRTVDEIDRLGDPRQVNMFGDGTQPTGADLVIAAIESIRKDFEVKPTADLFTPEIAAAKQVIDQTPDMRVVMDDGREVSVREAMKEVEDGRVLAENDAKAFEAAVTCYMRQAA